MTPCGAALKKVVYIIVLCEILCLDSILTNASHNIYVIVKLHRFAYIFCIHSCLIHQFICIAEKFVNYVIFNIIDFFSLPSQIGHCLKVVVTKCPALITKGEHECTRG